MLEELFEYPFIIKILNKILNDEDKIKIISSSKCLLDKKLKLRFNDKIEISQDDCDKWYYDCLININVKKIFKFPKHVEHLSFNDYVESFVDFKKGCIPNSVTHLIFSQHFDQNVEVCIPNSVTHLSFGFHFNQPVRGGIPNSVIHLSFGNYFDQTIKDGIPNSVTHLSFGSHFNKSIDSLPDSIIYLELHDNYNQKINKVPKKLKVIQSSAYFFIRNPNLKKYSTIIKFFR